MQLRKDVKITGIEEEEKKGEAAQQEGHLGSHQESEKSLERQELEADNEEVKDDNSSGGSSARSEAQEQVDLNLPEQQPAEVNGEVQAVAEVADLVERREQDNMFDQNGALGDDND